MDDFNGDRKDDFATSDYEGGSVSVRIKGTLPVLESVSPLRGRIGGVVTLTGRRFHQRRGTGVVRFAGVAATSYLRWSDGEIKVRVPEGTPKRSVSVTVTSIVGKSRARSFLRL